MVNIIQATESDIDPSKECKRKLEHRGVGHNPCGNELCETCGAIEEIAEWAMLDTKKCMMGDSACQGWGRGTSWSCSSTAKHCDFCKSLPIIASRTQEGTLNPSPDPAEASPKDLRTNKQMDMTEPENEAIDMTNLDQEPMEDIIDLTGQEKQDGWFYYYKHRMTSRDMTAFSNWLQFKSTTDWIINARRIKGMPGIVAVLIDHPDRRPMAKSVLMMMDVNTRQMMCPQSTSGALVRIIPILVREFYFNSMSRGAEEPCNEAINIPEADNEELNSFGVPQTWTIGENEIKGGWQEDTSTQNRWTTINNDQKGNMEEIVEEWAETYETSVHLSIRVGANRTWILMADHIGGLNPMGKHALLIVKADNSYRLNKINATTRRVAQIDKRGKKPDPEQQNDRSGNT